MIRKAETQDIPALLVLGAAMHAASRYSVLPWDNDKVAGLIDYLIHDENGLALVAFDGNDAIVGGFLGSVSAHYFSQGLVAEDYAMFVAPGSRGGLIGSMLLDAYVKWAQGKGAGLIQVGVTAGVNNDAAARVFNAVGFREIGQVFEFPQGVAHE
jgi:GNAT superfamily N-acetyltransferase